jgi:hypothetical protein
MSDVVSILDRRLDVADGGGDRNALVRRVCGHAHHPAGFCRFAL